MTIATQSWKFLDVQQNHEDPHKTLFGSLLEAIVATDAIRNYITESQKNV